jgi:hypothetical protein
MRRTIALVLAVGALAIPASAFGASDFGAGNSSAGPHDANAKCHPPGLTTDLAQCK